MRSRNLCAYARQSFALQVFQLFGGFQAATFTFFLVTLFPAPSEAQSAGAQPLTLEQCVALAEHAPSKVKKAQAELAAAQSAVRSAKASFLPQLTLSNTFIYNSPLLYKNTQFSFVALNGIHEYSSTANTSLELDSSGRLRALYDRANANRQIAEVSVAISERDLQRAVTVAYYSALLARNLARSAEANARAASDFESKVQHLVDAGEASRADLSKATAEAAMLDATAISVKTQAEIADHDLASFWTADLPNSLTLQDDLEEAKELPAPSSDSLAYLHRPEFHIYDSQIAGFNADARVARARMLPQLNLGFQYGIDSTIATARDRGYAGVIHLDIPVFDFLRAHNDQRAAKDQAAAAQVDAEIGRRNLSREYQDALSEVNGARAQLLPTSRQREAAQEDLRLSRLRFEAGEGSALDVVSAQNALVQAEINFYSARANYLNAQSALKVASGQ